jgi:transketolase
MNNLENWSALDDRAVAYARALAMDAVQKAGHGHPGTAMSLAPVAYNLFQRHLVHDPADPKWLGRDRFVLSCGHSSLTLYIQLFFSGYGLEMDDLKAFRTWNSLTPGHPEYGHTAGVEMTTGPLGAGVATAVGMAMAARFERGLLDPDAAANKSLFDHNIWVICSDGDLQEGVSSEASSLAGTQELGNLKVIYDDNRISIEGDTHVAFTEDVSARYRAYGWNVIDVPSASDGSVDLIKLDSAMVAAKLEISKPTLIRMKSVIAWPAPKARNTAESHGSALGAEEIAATKTLLGLSPDEHFAMPTEVLDHVRGAKDRGISHHQNWNSKFEKWQKENPDRALLLERLIAGELPMGWDSELPQYPAGKDVATRKASGEVIAAIAKVLPEFWGGSADLAGSNNTAIAGGSFLPATSQMKGANPYGRMIHFGIREHAMGSILNGIALHGLSRSFGGTFAVFSDYMRPAVRLAAIMNLPSIFIWSHDSIGLGEDGPTHQPVEHLASLRAIPNFDVVRPGDANEVREAWKIILKRRKPAGLLLSRQNLPVIDRNAHGDVSLVAKGAYILKEASAGVDIVLIATGSEVGVALATQELLEAKGLSTRVVSAPCLEWFNQTDSKYRAEVLPTTAKLRVSIEAGIAQGWRDYIGDSGIAISLEHFGASASASKLFNEFGFSPDAIVAKIETALKK